MKSNKEQQELMSQVIQRAWDDSEFKKSLIANPIETIEAEVGGKLNVPEGKTLVVLEQADVIQTQKDANKTYFIIPERPKSVELTEEQLETAVGGGVTVKVYLDCEGNVTGWEWECTISLF